MAMGIMTVTLSQWFSNGGMHTLRGRAGSDQFGALGKIFAAYAACYTAYAQSRACLGVLWSTAGGTQRL